MPDTDTSTPLARRLNPRAKHNTGRRGCPWPQNDPGRSCPPHTYCYRVGVCRREAAAYQQGRNAWEADMPLGDNPYTGVADLGYAWSRGWRDRSDVKG